MPFITRVAATSARGYGFTNLSTVTPTIGQAFGGGFFAGQISTAGNGVADFNLIIAPKSSGQAASLQWRTSNSTHTGADSYVDGEANTNSLTSATFPAGKFCYDLTAGGFSDWYLPAANELEICYYNLKPTTASNRTTPGSGANPNAVPARASNYSSSVPGQTSAGNFITSTGAEAFDATSYWTSTYQSFSFVRRQIFSDGYQRAATMTYTNMTTRAMRKVLV